MSLGSHACWPSCRRPGLRWPNARTDTDHALIDRLKRPTRADALLRNGQLDYPIDHDTNNQKKEIAV